MVEATKQNFEEAFVELQYEVKHCSFISIDCEFTSLPSDKYFVNSFFDSGDDRYNNIRKNLDQALILQVGITPFKFNRDLNHYKANPYKFYIFPRVFGNVNVSFLFKSSTIQFLCDHKFDFNKAFNDGISYLNRTNKNSILKKLYDDTLLMSIEENLSEDNTKEILRIYELVKKWKNGKSESDTFDFPVNPDMHEFNYLLEQRIRSLHKGVWSSNEGDKIVVKKVTKEERLKLDKMEKSPEVKEKFINSLLGFSKVYDMLAASKKPLVGHNLYLDLLIMYHQFYEDLPASHSKFKTNINKLFPCVYDTKFLSYELHRLTKQKIYTKNSLSNLYELFQDTNTMFYNPRVILNEKGVYHSVGEQKKHDAGWDSYMTGFVFLKLANQFAQEKRKLKVTDSLTCVELLAAVREWRNRINIARAKVSYVSLEGKDPVSTRPPILHVQRPDKQELTKLQLDDIFKKYGPVHKKLLTNNSAIIAVPNYLSLKSILNDFHTSEVLKVEKYSVIRHNHRARACCFAVFIAPLILAAWAGYKNYT